MGYLDELFSVAGKTALVTGAATGIGRMAATALVKAGADVMIASRKGADCEKAAAEINALGASGKAEGFAGDVSSEAGVVALADAVKQRTDRLDILINNAGASWGEPFATFPYQAWAKVLNVNVTGLFHLTRELMPLLETGRQHRRPGAHHQSGLGDGHAAARRRRLFLCRLQGRGSSFDAHAGRRIRRPPHHRQRLRAWAFPEPHDGVRHRNATSRRKRSARACRSAASAAPDDIAGATLYLCSRAGSYVTGAILPIDGGQSVQHGMTLFKD